MYEFALLVLLGLGAAAVVAFADRFMALVHEVRVIATVGIGIGLAFLADMDLWQMWGVTVREHWIGVLLTGLAIGAIGYVTHEIAALAAVLRRKLTDEAATIEKTQGIRRIA